MLTKIITKLKKIYHEEMFNPNFLGVFINPSYFVRKRLFAGIFNNKNRLNGKLLDFGCGHKPYQNIIDVQEYIGVDIEENRCRYKKSSDIIFFDGKILPFKDNFFDSLIATEVFEHVFNLESILDELFRVIRPGGYILVTVPFVWPEHGNPNDFARYTSCGISFLLENAGFKILSINKSSHFIETLFQLWNSYLSHILLPKNKVVALCITVFLISPFTILGIILSKIVSQRKELYLNNIIVAKKTLK